MPTLFEWNLILRYGAPLAVGIVSGHPKEVDGTKIHTSPILQAVQTEEGLMLKTVSGSVYQLRLEERNAFTNKKESLSPELLDLPADFWAQCAQAREKSFAKTREYLESFCKPGTLFLRIVETRILSAFWIGMDAQCQRVPVMKHLGMFDDSYSITNARQNPEKYSQFDFRLLQKWDHLEPYRISPCLKVLLVRNEGCVDITFGPSERKILCAAQSVTQISTKGLIEQ